MYDIDPKLPILRLTNDRPSTPLKPEPTAPIPFPAQLDRYLAKRDADAAILRLRSLAEADGGFARQIDKL